MPRTRIKICGITRNEDAILAASLGADALGVVFHPSSPRYIEVARLPEVLADLPAFVSVVGLFVNPARHEVEQVLASGYIQAIQFHGEETPEFCDSFAIPVLKAIRVQSELSTRQQLARFGTSRNVLLDGFDPARAGGSGKSFDWGVATRLNAEGHLRIVLAGGLNPDNVGAAITRVRPYAVDVSSGVESAPGIKDQDRLRRFFRAVHLADSQLMEDAV